MKTFICHCHGLGSIAYLQLLIYSTGLESFNLDLLRDTDKGPAPMEVGVSLSGGC